LIGVGVLYAYDLYGCRFCPTDVGKLTRAVIETARDAGMQVVEDAGGFFSQEKWGDQYGSSVITLVVPLKESHLAIHTWPAHRFVSVDFYTCGDPYKAYDAMEALAQSFGPERIERNTVWRGLMLGGDGRA